MENMKQRATEIESRIAAACERAGRAREDVRVIAVTKAIDVAKTKQVLEAGYDALGENRPEGLQLKYDEMKELPIDWHFIGNIQSRRVRDIIPIAHTLHSLQSISVAKQIENRAERVIDCFIQMNVSGEESKSGLTEEELIPFIEQLQAYSKVRVVGLMTMAPFTEDESLIRATFQRLREQRDRVVALNYEYAPCTFLSMGMSNDFEIAIEEGATHIRIGTALVGSESEGSR